MQELHAYFVRLEPSSACHSVQTVLLQYVSTLPLSGGLFVSQSCVAKMSGDVFVIQSCVAKTCR